MNAEPMDHVDTAQDSLHLVMVSSVRKKRSQEHHTRSPICEKIPSRPFLPLQRRGQKILIDQNRRGTFQSNGIMKGMPGYKSMLAT
jgi:hypothetical protein